MSIRQNKTQWSLVHALGTLALCLIRVVLSNAQDSPQPAPPPGPRNIVRDATVESSPALFTPLSSEAAAGNGGLFVGVNKFKDANVQPLRFAVNDAIEQCHLFVVELNLLPARQCVLALSGEAVGEGVQRHLDELKQRGVQVVEAEKSTLLQSFVLVRGYVRPMTGLLVVSFSSHGFTDKRVGYVMPSDGLRTFLEDTAVRLSSVEEQMNASQAGHRLLLVDACQERLSDAARSSGMTGGQAMTADFLELLKKPTGQSKLVSCDVGEYSYEHPELGESGHGVFTHAVLEALRGGAAADERNVVRLSSVSSYVSRSVGKWVEEQNRRRRTGDPEKKQSPSYQGPEAARELPLAKKADDLTTLVASVRKQPLNGGFTAELRGSLAATLGQLDLKKEADRELVSITRNFANGVFPASAFVPYLRAELERRQNPAPRPGDVITSPRGMKLAYIPAGEFWMGSDKTEEELEATGITLAGWDVSDESPRHLVQITRPFYLGIHEVTKGQFAKFVADTGHQTDAARDGKGGWGYDTETKSVKLHTKYNWRNAGWVQSDDHPVANVSWRDAVAYCNWLSRQEGKSECYRITEDEVREVSGTGYRLPREAEWEYACRAGTTTQFCTGDQPGSLEGYANVRDVSYQRVFPRGDYKKKPTLPFEDGWSFTSPVGEFKPNAWGVYDMHGNVCEWCSDWYSKKHYQSSLAADPAGPSLGSNRVFRGGGCFSDITMCMSSFRCAETPVYRFYNLGFRVAIVPASEK
ncbi:MAG: SUMF1/EgtB/PvdO family nonheme iron enzyme [Pirellulales bacterium]